MVVTLAAVVCLPAVAADPVLLPPVVTARMEEASIVVDWTLPPNVEADRIFIDVFVNHTHVASVTLPGFARQFVDAGRQGLIRYEVSYEIEGETSLPGNALLGNYPHCLRLVTVVLGPPFIVIGFDCIFPLPIG